MRLDRFHLQGFAQHQLIDLAFQSGVPTLVIGPNEAGKSNLLTAMVGTLYGLSSPAQFRPWSGEPAMIARLWFAIDGETIMIERRFLESEVSVSRNDAMIYRGRGLVEGRAAEDERYRDLLYEWIGFADADVFKRTVFVHQGTMHDHGLHSFSGQIKRLISGTREADYQTAIRDLDQELDLLIKRPGKRANRKREDLQDRLNELTVRYQSAASAQARLVELVEEEAQLRSSTDEATAIRDRYSALIKTYGEFQDLQEAERAATERWIEREKQLKVLQDGASRKDELERQLSQLRIPGDPEPEQVRKLIDQIDDLGRNVEQLETDAQAYETSRQEREELESQLIELQVPEELDPRAIERLQWEIEQFQREIHQFNELFDAELDRPEPSPERPPEPVSRFSPGTRRALLVAATALGLIGVVAGILIDPFLLVLIVIAIPLLLLAWLDRGRDRPSEATPAASERDDSKLETFQQQIAYRQEELDERYALRDRYLAQTGLATLEEVAERAGAYQNLRSRLQTKSETPEEVSEQLTQAREALARLITLRDRVLEESDETDLEAVYQRAIKHRTTRQLLEQINRSQTGDHEEMKIRVDEARRSVALAQTRREQLESNHPEIAHLEPERISEFRENVADAEQQLESATTRLREIAFEQRQISRESDDAAALQQEIQDIEREIDRVELVAGAHELAIETLRQSVQEFQENALDPVSDAASRHFATITSERYTGVLLDRNDMTPRVSGSGQVSIETGQLSRGAQEQLYLAIRAALVDALSGDRQLPLVLDDPCVNFDQERLAATAEMIAELSRTRQILLFSKDEIWTNWFEPVLRLQRVETNAEF